MSLLAKQAISRLRYYQRKAKIAIQTPSSIPGPTPLVGLCQPGHGVWLPLASKLVDYIVYQVTYMPSLYSYRFSDPEANDSTGLAL
jgi:hypothetical protein